MTDQTKINLNITGNVTSGGYFIGDGSQLTNLPAGLNIPKCCIEIKKLRGFVGFLPASFSVMSGPYVYAYFTPQQNNSFLNYNPQYWLFRYKRGQDKKRDSIDISVLKKFAHPIHMGQQDSINGGTNMYCGRDDLGLETQWNFSSIHPYVRTALDFQPYKLFRGLNETSEFPFEYSETEHALKGTSKKSGSKRAILKFAIVIDNPDNQSKYKKIIGPYSENVIIKIARYGSTAINWKIYFDSDSSNGGP